MFGGPSPTPPEVTPPTPMGLSPGAEEGFMRFLLKNNGVLFENEMLQIGVKSEYKKNLGQFITCTFYVKIMSLYILSFTPASLLLSITFSNLSLPHTLLSLSLSLSLSPFTPPPPPPNHHTHIHQVVLAFSMAINLLPVYSMFRLVSLFLVHWRRV